LQFDVMEPKINFLDIIRNKVQFLNVYQ